MKRTHTLSLTQLLDEVIAEYKIGGKLNEARIIAAWPEVLGPLARPTDKLYIKDNVLFVNLSSSVIRSELSMMRSTLVRRLNEKAGEAVINDIIFR